MPVHSVTLGPYTVNYNNILDIINHGDRKVKLAPLKKRITGPKELKMLIDIYSGVRNVFEKRLLESENGADYIHVVDEDTNKHVLIKLRSKFTDCLVQLEKLRKRFINNKQQRKTTHNLNRILLRQLRSLLPPPTFSEFGGGFSLEMDPQNTHPSVKLVKHIDNTSKEYYRSNARNILADINHIVTETLPELMGTYYATIEVIVSSVD